MPRLIQVVNFQTWYFGLSYTDANNQPAWLIKSKKISKQVCFPISIKFPIFRNSLYWKIWETLFIGSLASSQQ